MHAHITQLERELLALEADTSSELGIDLAFDGPPIVGQLGMDPTFAAAIAESASRALATPHLISDVVRGSFGFTFEPRNANTDEDKTSAREAEERFIDLIEAAAHTDNAEAFANLASETDSDVVDGFLSFLRVAAGRQVSVRASCGERELRFSREQLDRGLKVASALNRTDIDESVDGVLAGIRQVQGTFEIVLADNSVIVGRLHKSITTREGLAWQEFLNKPIRATLSRKRAIRQGQIVRESILLKDIALRFPAGT
jgi:hypothetical protein